VTLEISTIDGTPGGLRLRGGLDGESVDRLLHAFLDLLPAAPVIVDVSGIESMDGHGLRPFFAFAILSDGEPMIILRDPSSVLRRFLDVAIPDGHPGLWIEFKGAGPGAAHRLTELRRSTTELHVWAEATWGRAAVVREHAGRARARHADIQRFLSVA